MGIPVFDWVDDNILEKGENAGYWYFGSFPQWF